MSATHFADDLGVVPRGFDDGYYIVELEVEDRHLNLGGIVHGGVICTLLDIAMFRSYSMALPDEQFAAATLELKVNYLGSAKQGKLRCYGQVVNTTERTAYIEGGVEDAKGKLLAKGSGTMMLFSERRVR